MSQVTSESKQSNKLQRRQAQKGNSEHKRKCDSEQKRTTPKHHRPYRHKNSKAVNASFLPYSAAEQFGPVGELQMSWQVRKERSAGVNKSVKSVTSTTLPLRFTREPSNEKKRIILLRSSLSWPI